MKGGKLFLQCEVLGVESFDFVQKLHKLGIPTYNLSFSQGKLNISIDFKDRKKFFAFSRNMCYNITIIKYYGKVSPLKLALSNVGLALAICTFLVFAIAVDGYCTKIEYLGDGEYLAPKIQEVLESESVKERSFITEDFATLSSKILSSDERITFASVEKRGRVLYVETRLAKPQAFPLDEKKKFILATNGGVVSKINLLGGTALVKVGDKVEKGQALIGGYYEKDGEKIEGYALGEVEIICKYSCNYKSFAKGEKYKNRAVAVAKQNLGEEDIISVEVQEKTNGKEIVYEVTVYYLVIAR